MGGSMIAAYRNAGPSARDFVCAFARPCVAREHALRCAVTLQALSA